MNLYNHVARPGETPQDAEKVFKQLAEADYMKTLVKPGLVAIAIVVFIIGLVLGAILF